MSTQLEIFDKQAASGAVERAEPRIVLTQMRELSCENTQRHNAETPDTLRSSKVAFENGAFDKSVCAAKAQKKVASQAKQLIRFASMPEGR